MSNRFNPMIIVVAIGSCSASCVQTDSHGPRNDGVAALARSDHLCITPISLTVTEDGVSMDLELVWNGTGSTYVSSASVMAFARTVHTVDASESFAIKCDPTMFSPSEADRDLIMIEGHKLLRVQTVMPYCNCTHEHLSATPVVKFACYVPRCDAAGAVVASEMVSWTGSLPIR
jgi:hypothetical protein